MDRWAMLFPGQGSQYPGMGQELYKECVTARRVFEEADDTLGYKLSDIIFGSDPHRLTRTEFTQPALLTVGMAAYRVFMERIGSAAPHMAAGHSLGEWTALACAGAITFTDALRLVALRGRLMQEAADEGAGAMCAIIGLEASIVEKKCLERSAAGAEVVISNYNSPVQTVISGRAEAVHSTSAELEARGAKAVYLNVGAAFHSPLMAAAAEQLENALEKTAFTTPCWLVLSNVTALPHGAPDEIGRRLVEQITAPVQWTATMNYFEQAGISTVIELGPQTVLSRLAKANTKGIQAYSFEKPSQAEELHEKLKPFFTVSHSLTRGFITGCLTAAVSTRNRNWDEQAYQEGVVKPYRQIEAIQEQLDVEQREPSPEEMRAALKLLVSIFETKGVPDDEATQRLQEIVSRTATGHLFPEYTESVESTNRATADVGR
ncbi:ACP S-malonyltransferase [Paenibacillus xylaniclasticus]|uniref:ACP S-malonyltransferase n=1 Tax=Paenibacillus xylaniclasticus TaxID=588083 RepID=UPI000FDCA506|nr:MULTISPECIES: ACP S-malonyltransferase [Paenibacillus]GFN33011.1 hypothetical protein PCURB6_32710 [Paenibacillus curdlanolyticus]